MLSYRLNITIKITLFAILTIVGILPCYAQTVIDKKGTVLSVDTSKWRLSGTNIINKNTGNVGIGNNAPSYKLDVTGKIRVTDSFIANSARINSLLSGSISDSLLVVDPVTGIFKRISTSRINRPDSTTASNGLNLNGKDVRLGGSLTQATTITTSGTNTLALAGLQSGNSNDSIIVATNTGIIKQISSARINRPDSTTASNGLNLNGKDVRLGGSLTQATTITTSGTNTLALAGLQSGNNNTDSIMVATNTGVIKQISSSRFIRPDSTTASNGLNLNGKDVRLGGSLTQATTITTSGTNTFSLTGLQGGNINTDSFMVITSAGVIKRISYQGFDFPQLQIDADRTSNYSLGSSYATIVYNSTSTNVSSQWNTGTGIFTASSAGLYQIIVNNLYGANSTSNCEIRNRVILNGSTVHLEGAVSFAPYSGSGGINSSLVMSTVIQLEAGDNIRIQAGGEVGTVSVRSGTGQHNIKIIRLK